MNIFKQFWKSLYSPKDISRFRFQGIGKTILYVFMLVLLSTIPTFIYSTSTVKDGVTTFKETVDEDLPYFVIKDGKLETDEKKQIEHSSDHFKVFFDGTGHLTAKMVEAQSTNAFALLESEMVIVSNGHMQTQPYTLFQGFSIDQKQIVDFLDSMGSFLYVIMFIFGIISFIFAAGIKFVEISLIALIVKLLAASYNPKLEYRHFWRITAYCTTLPTLFFTVMSFLKTDVVGGVFVNWAVTLTMVYLVIKEIPIPKKKQKA
ncbi:DUF1189 domain-containing protein [Bacillus sp. 1P06AnD]|uniref:DUF1189 domain-containing protein n=1 Tax=Bacillus sp. 1P06AnD TaxID=3132208 RepID=UPI0039A2AD11